MGLEDLPRNNRTYTWRTRTVRIDPELRNRARSLIRSKENRDAPFRSLPELVERAVQELVVAAGR